MSCWFNAAARTATRTHPSGGVGFRVLADDEAVERMVGIELRGHGGEHAARLLVRVRRFGTGT